MYKGVFIYPRHSAFDKDNAFDWLKEEAALCGLSLEICFEEDCCIEYSSHGESISFAGKPMDDVDFVLLRVYNERISRYYENKHDVLVVNKSASMRLSKDKLLCHQALRRSCVPSPDTIYAPEAKYPEIVNRLGVSRFLVKKNDGSRGEGIYMVNNEYELAESLIQLGDNCIFQKPVVESLGRDVRVWVIGEKCVGAVLRYSETSFKSNYSQGGKCKLFELDPQIEDMARRATCAVGLDFAGVDILFSSAGYTVCEVNGNAGFRTISAVSDINVPAELFRYISKKIVDQISY